MLIEVGADLGQTFLLDELLPRIVDSTLGQYIRGQLLLGLVIGIVSFLGLNALNLFFGLDIPYTVVLALVAAIGELADNLRDDVDHVRIGLGRHKLLYSHRSIGSRATQVVAFEVHDHGVLRSLFRIE